MSNRELGIVYGSIQMRIEEEKREADRMKRSGRRGRRR